MKQICILRNTIQTYAWGSRKGISELLGTQVPSSEPQAELWMGAHPKAPSQVFYGNKWRALLELVNEFPNEILGERVAKKYNNRLPFLFKVLAAEQPLSIQAHPNISQAKEGFLRENKQGIAMDAFNRNYKDDNHKPEIICALSPFWALNGFRPVKEIIELLTKINSPHLLPSKKLLETNPNYLGLKQALEKILTMDKENITSAVIDTLEYVQKEKDNVPLFKWLISINESFPKDVGVLCTLLLNLVKLEPGQAMFLPARQLHAYLSGVGVELMANSDNVLRGGLTSKHMDIPELLKILDFSEVEISKLEGQSSKKGELVYKSQTEEFRLSEISVNPGSSYLSEKDRSIQILLITNGQGTITDLESNFELQVTKGSSAMIPASVDQYQIKGNLALFSASVP